MFKIKLSVAGDVAGAIGFEPAGMFYELAYGECIYVHLNASQMEALEVTYWDGGISVWIQGEFVILDKAGKKLDDLWGG
ncbi:hypothetical protein [Amycolatopsis nigrescens]|uniref:hypothetical protein n=1 Tax=Amycolatopsis nigrescens TaxID=381445 RepID=UPI00037D4F1A|nr:hypothetical protein [Amycolatopsis nigrescens]